MQLTCYKILKRAFDFTAALLGILVTSPVWLIAMLGVFISDPGPVFYVARRLGKDNKEFKMYKFRSMRQGNANEAVFRGEEDRIFPFGRFLRASKIDELPQLLCCLTGTMSVIGPRPAAKAQMEATRSGEYAIAATVKPGLSGPAALYDYIYGDSVCAEQEYEEKVLPVRMALEVYYVKHRCIGYDIKMIWYTVICILATVFKKQPNRILKELLTAAATVSAGKSDTSDLRSEEYVQ